MYMNTIYYKHKEKMYNINKKLKHNFIILQPRKFSINRR